MENKKIYMILGVVAVAGAAIYMMKKKETLESGMRLGASNGGDDMSGGNIEIFSELQKLYGSKVRIENARGNGQYRYYCVSKKDQKKADAGLEIGDEALINGTDVCTISDFYINDDGLKSCFQCEEVSKGDYDIPGGSRLEY